jgi:hypothetical protein
MKWVCWKIKGVDVRRNPSLIPGTRTLTPLSCPVAPFTPGFCGAVAPGPSGISGSFQYYAPFPTVVSVGGSARDCLTGANVREATEVLQPHGLSPGCARPTSIYLLLPSH